MLLSFHRKLTTTGVSAALQSGGACTLFAEAAGAAGLELPEFEKATARKLRKTLPSFANLNNPLDVTGPGRRRDAHVHRRARSPRERCQRRPDRVRRVPASTRGDESVWAEPVLQRVRELQKETKTAFASVAMSALSYSKAAKEFVDRAQLPFLQGHRAAAGAIRALVDLQSATPRDAWRNWMPTPPGRRRSALVRGLEGALDEEQGAALLELYGVKRPKEHVCRPREQAGEGGPRDRRPGRGEGAGTGDPTQGQARRCAARSEGSRRDRRGGGRGAPGGDPGRRHVAEGHRAADGERARGARRRRDRRAVRCVRHDAARTARSPRPARPTFVARSAHREAGAALRRGAGRRVRIATRATTICVRSPRRSSRSRARRTTCAAASPRWRPTPCWSASEGAVAVDALAEARPPE